MNQDAFGAEFGAMTEEDQVMVVGGGGGDVAYAVGWFVSYATSCMIQAIVVNNKLATGQTVYYAEGSGWF